MDNKVPTSSGYLYPITQPRPVMFPQEVDYDDRDRLLLATALLEYAGNPDDLEPGSEEERAYELLADLTAARGCTSTEIFSI
jgi:hypothetical protein